MGSTSMDAIDMASMGSMDMGHSAHTGQLGHMAHDMGGTSSFGMLAAHTLAALLSGLWLAHGERAAFRVLRAVAGWLAAPLRLPIGPVRRAAPPAAPAAHARAFGAGTEADARSHDHLSGASGRDRCRLRQPVPRGRPPSP